MSADTEAPEQGTDLVERLREYAGWANYSSLRNLLAEAADEITRLRLAISPPEGLARE